MPFNTPIEVLIAQSETFYAQYPRGGAPADEHKAQVARDIAIANADPETLDATCIANKNFHSPEDDRKLRGSPMAGNVEAA